MRSLFVLALLLAVFAWPSRPESRPPAMLLPPARAVDSCKPQGPIDVRLVAVASGSGNRVAFELSVRPLRDMQSLAWELQLPAGALPLSGDMAGTAVGARNVVSTARAELDLPLLVASDGFLEVTLVARGVFETTDEHGLPVDEAVVVSASVSWGEPSPDAPVVQRVGPDGELQSAVMLPSRHREGS